MFTLNTMQMWVVATKTLANTVSFIHFFQALAALMRDKNIAATVYINVAGKIYD